MADIRTVHGWRVPLFISVNVYRFIQNWCCCQSKSYMSIIFSFRVCSDCNRWPDWICVRLCEAWAFTSTGIGTGAGTRYTSPDSIHKSWCWLFYSFRWRRRRITCFHPTPCIAQSPAAHGCSAQTEIVYLYFQRNPVVWNRRDRETRFAWGKGTTRNRFGALLRARTTWIWCN